VLQNLRGRGLSRVEKSAHRDREPGAPAISPAKCASAKSDLVHPTSRRLGRRPTCVASTALARSLAVVSPAKFASAKSDLVLNFGITVTYFLSCGRPRRGQVGEEPMQVRPGEGPAERLRHGLIAVLEGE